jgi:hypothetical protein
MDLGNIIYVIAIIAYFIYQATRKKPADGLPDDDPEPSSPQKGMSFEDLLKEIRQAQNPKSPEPPTPTYTQTQEPEPTAAPFPVRPVSRRPPVVEEFDDEIKYYEGAYSTSKYKSYQGAKFSTTPEAPLVKFDFTSIEKQRVNPYAELLKNPQTLKQAVIVSEILRPKHF